MVSEKKILKVFILKIFFSLCDLDMQWTGPIWIFFKDGHIRIIPTKFGQIPASSLGIVLWSNCWRRTMDNRRCTIHTGRRTSNDHNSSPWANGSGELKILSGKLSECQTVWIQIRTWVIFRAFVVVCWLFQNYFFSKNSFKNTFRGSKG